MGHKKNRCQTEYGAATWRTTWRWQRSTVSECFKLYFIQFLTILIELAISYQLSYMNI